MKHEMRNQKRSISEAEARELLARGEYGILSTCGPDGQPYGVPLNYCLLADALYFHCAVAGHKLENLGADSRVSFCVVGKTELLPEQFATRYESVIVTGRAVEILGDEKQHALELLVAKYSPGFQAQGLKYIAAQSGQARVFRIDIELITGKARP
ncbi:MAG: pyridoxamine 5'-phosphate oxidase family protein [Desulfobulbaceae bacterium]|nr:pyridoxamine 5'-phosphate oxidase family protein [Desulfobulbaceae bacterium]